MSKIISLSRNIISSFVHFISSLFHPGSIRKLFVQIFALSLSIFILLFLIISFSYSSIVHKQVYVSMKETLALHNRNISQGLLEALNYLSENCLSNSDISLLNVSDDPNEIYLSASRIKTTLSVGNYSLSNIGGLFVYSESKDIYIPQTNESWNNTHNTNQNNLKCSKLVLNLLRESNRNGTMDELNTKSWFLLSDEKNDFLVRILKRQNTYAGAWTELNYLSSAFDSFDEMGATILYTDEDGYCIGNPEFEGVQLDPEKSLESLSYYSADLFHRYLTVSAKLDYCNYYITVLIPSSYVSSELTSLYGLMFFLVLWLFLLGITLVVMMSHFFHIPSQILNPVIESMRKGQFATKIETNHEFQEIRHITGTFNEMIGEIQNLRIHIYEEQLAKKDLELQYLKTQIAPHFLINCLNTIFVLSQDQANQETTHRIVSTLSDHLRYTLATRTNVSLSEELHYVKNYLLLTQLRFPNTLSYEIQVEPAARDAAVFPLILLMLTENSIKANLVMGESFHIRIQGHRYEKNGCLRVHLVHIDSGNGFDEDSLQLYNHITEHPEVTENGCSIGLYNTAMRLHLTMDASAEILFSNEPGQGARIDIDFPYMPFTEEQV